MAIKFRYVGDGANLPGVPARDLTDDDLADLTPEQRADVAASAIYEAAGKGDAKAAAVNEGG